MSNGITISEGGTSRPFIAKKLKTKKQGGGYCYWIPEADTSLGTKFVYENGIYRPEDDGKYGFSQFGANVTDSSGVTGKGQDGNTYRVEKEGGGSDELVTEKIPSEIVITQLPRYIVFGDGGYINFEGIEVTAYYGDGTEYGVIPFEELIFPVTVARYSDEDGEVVIEMNSDLDCGVSKPIPTGFSIVGHGTWKHGGTKYMDKTSAYTGGTSVVMAIGYTNPVNYGFSIIGASKEPDNSFSVHTLQEYTGRDIFNTIVCGQSAEVNGLMVYWGFSYSAFFGPYERTDTQIEPIFITAPLINGGETYTQTDQQFKNMIYTMLYGNGGGIGDRTGGMQVPVQWMRPQDGEILETSYGIDVIPTFTPST